MCSINKRVFIGLWICIGLFFGTCCSRVLELDDRFLEAKKNGEWLVMFYAPWCGHCRQLEPTWKELGDAMEGNSVHVARLDCTRYSAVSGEFGVRGFPTIKFISGDNEYEYRGARTKNDIMAFVEKAKGPKISDLNSAALIKAAQKKHDVFFLYVGDSGSDLYKAYEKVAGKLFLTLHLYAAPSHAFPSEKAPTVLVFKDDTHYKTPLSSKTVGAIQLAHWITSEQIPDYSELTGISYHNLKGTKKLFVVSVLDEKSPKNLKMIVKSIALSRNDVFHPKFVFCWAEGNSIINRMTYGTISVPNVVVFNPENYEYYILSSEDGRTISGKEVNAFLTDVAEGKMPALGGSGFFQQVMRFFSDATTTVVNFFKGSPIMASLVIGVPTFVITFLCYCLCTMEDFGEEGGGTDSENEDEEEEEDEAERLPEYEPEETDVRKRNKEGDEEPGASQQASGDAAAETEKDK